MKNLLVATLTTATLMSTTLMAQDLEVKITNNTNGIFFTPLLVSAHPSTTSLFTLGNTASSHLKAMAEGGDISGLKTDLDGVNANSMENPAEGLLTPGSSTTTMLSTESTNTLLSITAMMLPTNDGFIGLNGWKIPTKPGTYTININAYDAGSEANTELGADIPQPPVYTLGTNGSGFDVSAEGYVHIHRGNIGDSDATGDQSDLNVSAHRWLNPVATVIVTVK